MNRATAAISRRRFLALAGASGTAALVDGMIPSRLPADTRVEIREAWAHVDRLADGVWGVLSTPVESEDWRTGSNGGLVAGRDRVLAIEGFLRAEGASWVADIAERLAGRRPSDLLVTHHHGDHSGGIEGYADGGDRPVVWMTETTRDIVLAADERGDTATDSVRQEMLQGVKVIPEDEVTQLDLGGRVVEFHPRSGHTESDVSVEITEPSLVFCGDLLWNGFFPNYVHTTPSKFAASVRAARREVETIYVPGHGFLANDDAVGDMLTLIDAVEEAARAGAEQGRPAAEVAAAFSMPEPVVGWTLFNPGYVERAVGSWYKELGVEPAA